MFITKKLIASLALLAIPAAAGPLLYVVNIAQQFGSVDTASGTFQQIGPGLPEGMDGLAAGPNGSLLGISYASNLYSINPATGISKFVGPTGLGDCTVPDASPCGPTSNLTLGASAGKVYATDFENRLYSVNPLTGAATLIGSTGIPAVPFIPGSLNPNGTLNFYDQALFDAEVPCMRRSTHGCSTLRPLRLPTSHWLPSYSGLTPQQDLRRSLAPLIWVSAP